jgi:hypothetical protein
VRHVATNGRIQELEECLVIVYADFSCAYSYVASHRVDTLAEVGVEVDWRAIEHDPSLPVTGQRLDRGGVTERETQLNELLLPTERLSGRVPGFVPNTEAAVTGYAEACGAGVAAQVRRVLFAAYWVRGLDIGSAEVLRRLLAGPLRRGHSTSLPVRDFGYAVSPSRGPITTGAWRRIRAWAQQWRHLECPCTPALVMDNGAPVYGADALRHLAAEITRLAAPVNPELPDPANYEVLPTRPAWW